jgi:Recombinase
MSRRRQRRKAEKARRDALSSSRAIVVREATDIERLAYTRTQSAEALGVSRSTFDRRVLPLLETVDMPWGTRLVPIDELERLVAQRRRPMRGRAQTAPPGRPTAVPDELVRHIRAKHAKGVSIRQIARDLNASQTPTAHGGAQWWPSTVQAILRRASTSGHLGQRGHQSRSSPKGQD